MRVFAPPGAACFAAGTFGTAGAAGAAGGLGAAAGALAGAGGAVGLGAAADAVGAGAAGAAGAGFGGVAMGAAGFGGADVGDTGAVAAGFGAAGAATGAERSSSQIEAHTPQVWILLVEALQGWAPQFGQWCSRAMAISGTPGDTYLFRESPAPVSAWMGLLGLPP